MRLRRRCWIGCWRGSSRSRRKAGSRFKPCNTQAINRPSGQRVSSGIPSGICTVPLYNNIQCGVHEKKTFSRAVHRDGVRSDGRVQGYRPDHRPVARGFEIRRNAVCIPDYPGRQETCRARQVTSVMYTVPPLSKPFVAPVPPTLRPRTLSFGSSSLPSLSHLRTGRDSPTPTPAYLNCSGWPDGGSNTMTPPEARSSSTPPPPPAPVSYFHSLSLSVLIHMDYPHLGRNDWPVNPA